MTLRSLCRCATMLAIWIAVSHSIHGQVSAMELYVAPIGNDAWSGKAASPNSAGTDGPLATVCAAVTAARSHAGKEPVTVWVREGTYYLEQPLEFTSADSGTSSAPITYAAYPGEKPVLSAGRRLNGWRPAKVNGQTVWTAQIPEVARGARDLRQLFVNGERRLRARMPNAGWFEVAALPDVKDDTPWHEGQTRFEFAPGDLKAWDDADEGEVVPLHFWVDSHLPIASVDEASRIATFAKRSVFRMTGDHGKKGCIYYVENVLAALDQPGEWVIHRKSGTLYYLPMPGEDIATFEAVIAVHPQVVRFSGEPESGKTVDHIRLQGLTFSHAEWWLSDSYEPEWPNKDIGGMVQAAFGVPGAIRMRGARDCVIEDCTVAHVGTYGIELERGCQDNTIVRNTITDLGAGGVKIGETSIRELAAEQTHRNTVTDNVISSGGRVFHSAVGVWIGHSGGNVVAHNDIHDFYYTGISVGWSWGYGRSLATHNRIEQNHIYTIGQGWLSDMGAIYLLGVAPGTTVRNNLIHDITSRGYGGWGIYPDEGSSHLVIEDNIVYRTNRCGFHLHYGKDNLVRNNIFALSGEAQICRTRPDPFVFTRNIVYWSEGNLLGGNWSELNVVMAGNLYFDTSGKPITPAGKTWAEWTSSGMDAGTVIADPGFRDPSNGDFTLLSDSPAWDVGFRPIDMESVGPRR
ncbi:hypothetical protein FJZ36_02690 [Candidatus Poribacteria bacterium]|nr:hypothetical protein [Candidatus Poribacteria bacterium]